MPSRVGRREYNDNFLIKGSLEGLIKYQLFSLQAKCIDGRLCKYTGALVAVQKSRSNLLKFFKVFCEISYFQELLELANEHECSGCVIRC